ncbi:urea ABC transporter permease subunit UrtB [Pseudodonghicola flavimaris]|uniref:Urea ABC transporter permease subunit UrtB n=1 Tax=Pseudodonghicola flavimaris TaxID=3050036 RepID=A0ABT7F0S9_9RHOB|nr:urea ABC transporter permease subunit UrtB [Pseudodonghicola flavimaris]MDK3018219.1 urea ABC transporter permease subunit UrtB [Pseudodonghicola flavimaris]
MSIRSRIVALPACLLLGLTLVCAALVPAPGQAQDTAAGPIQSVLQAHRALIEKSSRKTVGEAIDAITGSGLPQAQSVLESWQAKEMWQRETDGYFFRGREIDRDTVQLYDFDSGADLGPVPDDDLKQLKPNSGVRGLIGAALVRFQLTDPDPEKRRAALDAIARDAEASHLDAIAASIAGETDAAIKAAKERTLRLLTIRFSDVENERLAAIRSFKGDLGVDARAALNPLLATKVLFSPEPPVGNIAHQVSPGGAELSVAEAHAMMVTAGATPALPGAAERKATLIAHIDGGKVGGVPIGQLDTQAARDRAYAALAEAGVVAPFTPGQTEADAVASGRFWAVYDEPSAAITDAAAETLAAISTTVGVNQALDLTLDALSLASIYFLAAIGLAITFGVMGVINMAHGEFIMMGAYTGYVIQQIVPDYTLSILLAIPVAFAVTFAAGVAMERLVIRWLYHRPLETLLATFGISIALQQLAKNIFGTQARPLTAPAWLDGAWALNDVVGISYIRIAIFVLALVFLAIYLWIMNRTRLGLETRAVTQNPKMAGSMGINPDRVNMLTFGLGSGIAGIAGVAIGLFAKVTSELGQDYIVQSFMTVVVGGVGNVWGTLAGATLIGFLQKGIEWLNPSNTLAAQTYMIIFIIIFIQFRPRGIIALKGRAAGD